MATGALGCGASKALSESGCGDMCLELCPLGSELTSGGDRDGKEGEIDGEMRGANGESDGREGVMFAVIGDTEGSLSERHS